MKSKIETPVETLLTIARFFAALHRLKDEGKYRGVQTFCTRHNINRRNLYVLEHDIENRSGIFEVAWLTYLIRDHAVSAHWLLTGEGDFYTQKASEISKKAQNQRNLYDGVV